MGCAGIGGAGIVVSGRASCGFGGSATGTVVGPVIGWGAMFVDGITGAGSGRPGNTESLGELRAGRFVDPVIGCGAILVDGTPGAGTAGS